MIPADCLSIIFSYLNVNQLSRLIPVSKYLQYLILTNSHLWQQVNFHFSNLNSVQKWFELCDTLQVPVLFLQRVAVENLQLVNVDQRILSDMSIQLVDLSLHSVYLNNYSFLVSLLHQCDTLKSVRFINVSGRGPLKNLGCIAGRITTVDVSGELSHSMMDLMNWILSQCVSSITSVSIDSMNTPSELFNIENLTCLKIPANAINPILYPLSRKKLKTLHLTSETYYQENTLLPHSAYSTELFCDLQTILLNTNTVVPIINWCIEAFERLGRKCHFICDHSGNLGLNTTSNGTGSKNVVIPIKFKHDKPLQDPLYARILEDTLSQHTQKLSLNNFRLERSLMESIALKCTHLTYIHCYHFNMQLSQFVNIIHNSVCSHTLSGIHFSTCLQSLAPSFTEEYESLKPLHNVRDLTIQFQQIEQRLGGDNAVVIHKCFPSLVSLKLVTDEEYWQRNMLTDNQFTDSNNWIEIFTDLYSTMNNVEKKLKDITLLGRFNSPGKVTYCPAVHTRNIEYIGTWKTQMMLNLAFPNAEPQLSEIKSLMETWSYRLKWISEYFQDEYAPQNLNTILQSIENIKQIYLIQRNIEKYPVQSLVSNVDEEAVGKAMDLVARAMHLEYNYFRSGMTTKRRSLNASYTEMMASYGAQMMTMGASDNQSHKKGLSYLQMVKLGSDGIHSRMRQLNEAEKYFSRVTSRNQMNVDSVMPLTMVANKAWKRVSNSAYELDRQIKRTQRRTSRANIFKFYVFFCVMSAFLAFIYHKTRA
jgi:hypothetical protein